MKENQPNKERNHFKRIPGDQEQTTTFLGFTGFRLRYLTALNENKSDQQIAREQLENGERESAFSPSRRLVGGKGGAGRVKERKGATPVNEKSGSGGKQHTGPKAKSED